MFVKFGDNPKQNFLIKFKLQDEALRIINFLPNTALVSEICKTSKILKPSDYISLKNALLVKNCFEKQLPQPLLNVFKKIQNSTITECDLPQNTLYLWRKQIENHME